MGEGIVPALVVVGALIFIGFVLLLQRIGQTAKRRSDQVTERLMSQLRPSQPPSHDRTQDKKFIERLLDGAEQPPDQIVSTATGARSDPATEQTFRNMFFTSADKGEGLLDYYMTRYQCDRADAMRRAIKEREREGRD